MSSPRYYGHRIATSSAEAASSYANAAVAAYEAVRGELEELTFSIGRLRAPWRNQDSRIAGRSTRLRRTALSDWPMGDGSGSLAKGWTVRMSCPSVSTS